MKFLGIYREPEYSPGRHTSNDTQILRLVAQGLEQFGVQVQLASLEEARSLWKNADLIFSMCQGPKALTELVEWKAQGARILNDPKGSLGTYRENLCRTLSHLTLPFPRSLVLNTDVHTDPQRYQDMFKPNGAWLKRSDVHATQPADVIRVKQWQDLPFALEMFQVRGLSHAILQEHVEGDEVKFYGVVGGRFFWPYYPKDCVGHPFDESALQKMAEGAAETLGVSVYGGDAIIAPNGTVSLIDLNDWPSFAPCRGAAAFAIAHFLKESYVTQNNRTPAASQ